MALNAPTPGLTATQSGLRRIFYDARSAAKVELVVQPGDELEVSDDVAEQLLRSSAQFKQVDEPVSEPDQGEDDEKPTPKKRAAKKRASSK